MSKAICRLFTVGNANRIHFHSSINERLLIIPRYIDQTIFRIILWGLPNFYLFSDELYLMHLLILFHEKNDWRWNRLQRKTIFHKNDFKIASEWDYNKLVLQNVFNYNKSNLFYIFFLFSFPTKAITRNIENMIL